MSFVYGISQKKWTMKFLKMHLAGIYLMKNETKCQNDIWQKDFVNKKAWVIISVAINTATYPVSNITCSLLLIYLLINRFLNTS